MSSLDFEEQSSFQADLVYLQMYLQAQHISLWYEDYLLETNHFYHPYSILFPAFCHDESKDAVSIYLQKQISNYLVDS